MKIKAKMKVKKPRTRIRRVLSTVLTFLIIAVVTYGFLSVCYWSLNLTEWGGFGRFLLGVEGVIFLIKIYDEW